MWMVMAGPGRSISSTHSQGNHFVVLAAKNSLGALLPCPHAPWPAPWSLGALAWHTDGVLLASSMRHHQPGHHGPIGIPGHRKSAFSLPVPWVS